MRAITAAFAAASVALMAAVALLPFVSSAGAMDESMFVGTWSTDDVATDLFYLEWRSDGTGREWFEDSSGEAYSEYEFDWKLEGGKYKVSFDDGSSWTVYDYDFSTTYDELTLTDEYGSDTYTREGMPDMGCCCCCCGGFVIAPVGAVSLLAATVVSRRRK